MTVPIIFKDKFTVAVFAASLVVLAVAFWFAYGNLADADSLLVIHFDSYKGIDFFGDRKDVFDILLTSGIIWLVNLVLANEFYFRERVLSYFIASATLLFTVLILIGVNVIISVN